MVEACPTLAQRHDVVDQLPRGRAPLLHASSADRLPRDMPLPDLPPVVIVPALGWRLSPVHEVASMSLAAARCGQLVAPRVCARLHESGHAAITGRPPYLRAIAASTATRGTKTHSLSYARPSIIVSWRFHL
jgi:hypothetical protein